MAAVLARRTAAVKSGDKDAFLADIDPTNEDFLADQARLFDNLQLLPLARAAWEQNGDHAVRRGHDQRDQRRSDVRPGRAVLLPAQGF